MPRESQKESCYKGCGPDCPEKVFIVSKEAHEEKHRNWHEIHGVGDGWAEVSHPEWLGIASLLGELRGSALLIHVEEEDGTLVHVGSICYNTHKHGVVEVRG